MFVLEQQIDFAHQYQCDHFVLFPCLNTGSAVTDTNAATKLDVVSRYNAVASTADEVSRVGSFFVRRSLKHLSQDKFLSPRIVQKLATAFEEEHFLILGGRVDGQVTPLIPHIAWALHVWLQKPARTMQFDVLEYQPMSDSQYFNLVNELYLLETPSIVIITSASRHCLGYAFPDIRKVAFAGSHYILCSSDEPEFSWHFNSSEKHYWMDLSRDELFDQQHLIDLLCRGLELHQSQLLPRFQRLLEPSDDLLPGLTIREVAIRLQGERAITIFLQFLCAVQEPILEADLVKLVDIACQADDQAIKQWYYGSLSQREQLLALGMGFFDGLLEDQVFAALDNLIFTVWQQKNSGLSIFDYIELKKLRAFYVFDTISASRVRIKSTLPDQRQILLGFAWDSYRNHIRATIPWLIQLVKESVKKSASERNDLFGSEKQREDIRLAVAETISDIGVLSAEAIQDALLWLVADRHHGVQVVGARMMARWYAGGKHQQFFETIALWSNNRSQAFIKQVLDEQYGRDVVDVGECVNIAILLAVTYAAKTDLPDQCDVRIDEMIRKLLEKPGKRLLKRIGQYTVPMLLPLHSQRMSEIFRRMLIYEELHRPMADTLIAMHKQRPKNVIDIIGAWSNASSRASIHYTQPQRHRTRAFISRVLIGLWYLETLTQEQRQQILQRLVNFVKQEHVTPVYTTVFDEVFQRNKNVSQFFIIEPLLLHITNVLREDEQEQVVIRLIDAYKKQRSELKGGDGVYLHQDGTAYETWIDTHRPSTMTEQALYRWMTSDAQVKAQELALKASIAIADVFEIAEDSYRHKEFERRRKAEWEQTRIERVNIAGLRVRRLIDMKTITGWIKAVFNIALYWIATLMLRVFRAEIRNLLPEADVQYRSHKKKIGFLLDKWLDVFDFSELPDFSRELTHALRVVSRRRLLFGILLTIIILLALGVIILLRPFVLSL